MQDKESRKKKNFLSSGIIFIIFILTDLDFATLAKGFALLKMPKMPELRGKCFPDFTPVTVNTDSIPFKDKNREKQRQKQLQQLEQQRKERQESGGKKKLIKNKSWSKQKAKKEKKKKATAKRKHEEVNCAHSLKKHVIVIT